MLTRWRDAFAGIAIGMLLGGIVIGSHPTGAMAAAIIGVGALCGLSALILTWYIHRLNEQAWK